MARYSVAFVDDARKVAHADLGEGMVTLCGRRLRSTETGVAFPPAGSNAPEACPVCARELGRMDAELRRLAEGDGTRT
jgi:hypothetical protein